MINTKKMKKHDRSALGPVTLALAALAGGAPACSGAACAGLAGAAAGCTADTFAVSGDDAGGDDSGDAAAAADGPQPDAGTDASPGDVGMSADAGDPQDGSTDAAQPPPFRRVFLTSAKVGSAFGGLPGADSACAAAAAAASLGGAGSWKAWLSTSTASPASRLEHAAVPYQLVDGTEVAKSWQALTTGTLEHAIDEDEHGVVLSFDEDASTGFSVGIAWTGTGANGTASVDTCNDWTATENCAVATTLRGTVGRDDHVDPWWTSWALSDCCSAEAHSILCFEQY